MSDTLLKSLKETRKHPSNTFAKTKSDSKFVNGDKSVESIEEEDNAKEKAKEPSPKKSNLIAKGNKGKAPFKSKGTSPTSIKKFVSHAATMSNKGTRVTKKDHSKKETTKKKKEK